MNEVIISLWRHQMETSSALLALCEGIHQLPVDSPHTGQWRGVWCFPWSAPERTVKQRAKTPVIWDAIVRIMTSLQCGGIRSPGIKIVNATDGVRIGYKSTLVNASCQDGLRNIEDDQKYSWWRSMQTLLIELQNCWCLITPIRRWCWGVYYAFSAPRVWYL